MTPTHAETETLVKLMLRDPLAQRYALRSQASGDNRVYTADDVLGERIVRLAGLIGAEHFVPGLVAMGDPPDGDRIKYLITLASQAKDAIPYLWTEEVRSACGVLDLPRHVISPKVLPQPRMWHTFETGITVGGTIEHHGRKLVDFTVDSLFVADAGIGIVALMIGEAIDADTGDKVPSITGGGFKYGSVYPDDYEKNGSFYKHVSSTLTMMAFLSSPYIPKHQHAASRAARREIKRAGFPNIDDQLVTFVILRQPTKSTNGDSESSDGSTWHHRWIVNGHLRAQWYPSEQAHHLIWIAPYMKGPEDAPLLQHAYKVAR